MLVVDIGTDKVKVVFQHFFDTTDGARCTSCDIFPADKVDPLPTQMAYGKARCSLEDQYNKETGRKISLARALKDGKYDSDQRTKIWEAYWTKTTRK